MSRVPVFASAGIAVATVNYGTSNLVISALPTLLEELAPLRHSVALIVDNASPGGDAEALAAHIDSNDLADRVKLIRSQRNGGFAAGNNLAFSACRALDWTPDAVLLLNPDAEMRPGALREMYAVMLAQPRAGVIGARLENPDGSTWVAAFHFPTAMSEFAFGTGLGALTRRWPRLIDSVRSPVRVDWVSGAAMLVRWPVIETLGNMDEGFFLYFEEIDFMREAAAAGWESWHAPAALVRHAPGGATGMVDGRPSRGRMPDYWFDSWRRYFVKAHGSRYARGAALLKIFGVAIGMMQRKVRGQLSTDMPGFLRDFVQKGLLGRMRDVPSRREP